MEKMQYAPGILRLCFIWQIYNKLNMYYLSPQKKTTEILLVFCRRMLQSLKMWSPKQYYHWRLNMLKPSRVCGKTKACRNALNAGESSSCQTLPNSKCSEYFISNTNKKHHCIIYHILDWNAFFFWTCTIEQPHFWTFSIVFFGIWIWYIELLSWRLSCFIAELNFLHNEWTLHLFDRGSIIILLLSC